MNPNHIKKIKLTEKDKKTIISYSNICTDQHGRGCSINAFAEYNKKLN